MSDSISVGISFPKKVIEQIDVDRKDVSRSRYLLRILESYAKRNIENNSLDTSPAKAMSSESTR
jgi:hypothetical protein